MLVCFISFYTTSKEINMFFSPESIFFFVSHFHVKGVSSNLILELNLSQGQICIFSTKSGRIIWFWSFESENHIEIFKKSGRIFQKKFPTLESVFTHSLNTDHIMTLFADKFIRQAKLFCIYCIDEDVGWLPISGSINRNHCIALQHKSLLGGEKYSECWLIIQGLTVA